MNNKYVTVAEAAKQIRAKLKAAGVPARAVSVRSDSYSMGSSIRVEIKTLDVPYHVVETAARAEEEIRRDDFGEILGGGNRYVSVTIDHDAVKAAAASVNVDVDGCFSFRGFKVCPVVDGFGENMKQIGWHVGGLQVQRWGRLETIACVVEEIYKADRPKLAAGAVDVAALDAMFE